MAIPSEKSEGIEEYLDKIAPNPKGRRGSILADECVLCGGPAKEFREEFSRKEYTISGLCQACQDSIFGE